MDTFPDSFPDSYSLPPRHPKKAFSNTILNNLQHTKPLFEPRGWEGLFDKYEDIKLDQGTFRVYTAGSDGPYVLLLHGCGMSALSFALFANAVKPFCRIIAPDFRGHGGSHTEDDYNMSRETLAQDTKSIVHKIIGDDKTTPFVVLGHSMGGGIASYYCHIETDYTINGLILFDIVEGSALSSLTNMNLVIQRRPKQFESIEQAISWSLSSGLLQNRESACISIPDQIKQEENHFVWKVDLIKTEPYWEGWYKGMDNLFLTAPGYKLLAVARRDTLDTPMTIAHMQGKYQMLNFNGLGHNIHEDSPIEMAHVLQRYLFRYKLINEDVQNKLLREQFNNASIYPL